MLKRLYNEARFTLSILTTGPVLVRSGFPTLTGPDMTPVLTYRSGEWQVYLPGSSLKGVIRSHLEKICRTLRAEDPVVCDPFRKLKDLGKVENGALVCPNYADVFCGDKFERRAKEKFKLEFDKSEWRHKEEKLTTEDAYGDSCPICRLFGSTEFIGRVSIGDAYLDSKAPIARPTELRDGVGIDRLTGGAFGRALFNLETVSSNVLFRSTIHVRNFEDWQLGMLLTAAQDMTDGLIRIGSGRSRGFGSVTAKVHEVTVSYIGPQKSKPDNEVWGLGRFLARDGQAGAYRTFPDDVLTVPVAPAATPRGIRHVESFKAEALTGLTEAAAGRFVERIRDWETPNSMKLDRLQYHR